VRAAYTRAVAVSPRLRGFLRLYLGAAAGVGKTYQMLGDARLAAEEGADLVIGYLEPHGRQATEERARGLERAPLLRSGAGGRAETEPDYDWLMERRPSVAIIDELAHTNAAGSARPKRYDDVAALLDGGIDVWTTVNIQHLESLNSRIRALTGVDVRETFPDRLLHEADEIRLVDLSPRSLRERIARGLVYPADRVDAALAGFFTVENLTALRALVLHELAEVAAAELETSSPGARPIERVLVAIGARRETYAYLIRTGARLARRSDSELYVLCVEPQDGRVDDETARVLSDAEALARSLGAVFLRRRADNPASEIIREASAQHITQIVIGKSRRSPWRTRLGGSLVEAVLRGTSGIDVHVVADPGGGAG
jgi:two-component system sensor histidine kinase KdpD